MKNIYNYLNTFNIQENYIVTAIKITLKMENK